MAEKPYKTSVRGRKFLKQHEGLRLCPYKVPGANERYWTIGYGHYGADVKPGVCITEKRAGELLKGDLEKSYEPAVRKVLKEHEGIHQCEIDALVSIAYNLGPGIVSDPGFSTLAKRLGSSEAKTYKKRKTIYRQEFPKWVYAGGVKFEGLVNRRKDEVALATEGKYT
ncbi:MAG: lysozyme [Chloroflexi bacterium]|nr:MAG: lysozyme [Chloroflexota bacterium]